MLFTFYKLSTYSFTKSKTFLTEFLCKLESCTGTITWSTCVRLLQVNERGGENPLSYLSWGRWATIFPIFSENFDFRSTLSSNFQWHIYDILKLIDIDSTGLYLSFATKTEAIIFHSRLWLISPSSWFDWFWKKSSKTYHWKKRWHQQNNDATLVYFILNERLDSILPFCFYSI